LRHQWFLALMPSIEKGVFLDLWRFAFNQTRLLLIVLPLMGIDGAINSERGL